MVDAVFFEYYAALNLSDTHVRARQYTTGEPVNTWEGAVHFGCSPFCWFTLYLQRLLCSVFKSMVWLFNTYYLEKVGEFLLLLAVALGKHIVWISVAYQVALISVILRWYRFWDWQSGTVLVCDFSIPLRCSWNDNGDGWGPFAYSWQESLSTRTEILRWRLVFWRAGAQVAADWQLVSTSNIP